MKLGQLIETREILTRGTREIFFFKSHVENEAGRLVPYLFRFLKKLHMR